MAGSYARYNGLSGGGSGGGGTGTVTSVSVAIANGLAGDVTSPTTTPTIMLKTTVTGVLKGDGTAISEAIPGTDYQPSGDYITALTGDITASGPGSAASTLAIVNTNTGSFGSSTAIPNFIANAKGLITAAGTNAVIAPAGTLTGSTLASGVTASSLTSVGPQAQALNMGSHKITAVTDPSSAQDAATKAYVDAAVSALNPAAAVYAATTVNITGTYLNGVAGVGAIFTITATGVFTLDGTTPPAGSRILVKNQSTGFQNGIYDLTVAGTTGVSPVLTRSADYNTAADMNSAGLIPVINGTANALSSWQQVSTITTVGTDALVFTEFTANPSLYMLKANNLSDVSNRQTSLNTLAGAVTSARFLRGDGSNVSMSAIQASDVPTLNQNTSGTAASVTGTNVVTNSNLSQMATNTLKGNNNTGTSNSLDLNVSQVKIMLSLAGNFSSKTTTYQILSTDYGVLCNAFSAAFTVTLPDATLTAGQEFLIKKNDTSSNIITIATTSSQAIDGITSVKMGTYNDSILVQSNGTDWSVVSLNVNCSASYWVSANFTASPTIPINLDSKEYDSQNAVVTSATAWKYAPQFSGLYNVNFYGYATSSQITGVYKSGTLIKNFQSSLSSANGSSASTSLRLSVTDYIDIRPTGSVVFAGGSLNGASVCRIEITRTGN